MPKFYGYGVLCTQECASETSITQTNGSITQTCVADTIIIHLRPTSLASLADPSRSSRGRLHPATRFIVEELEFASSPLLVHITPVSSSACSNLTEPRQIIHVRIFSDCTVYGDICLSG